MPLTFDNTACENLDLAGNEDHRVLREAAVWASMAVGINHLTLDNAREFYARVSFHELVNGSFRFATDDDGTGSRPHFFSTEDVLLLVGMRTNVSPKTKAQFYKGVWSQHESYNVPRNFPETS